MERPGDFDQLEEPDVDLMGRKSSAIAATLLLILVGLLVLLLLVPY